MQKLINFVFQGDGSGDGITLIYQRRDSTYMSGTGQTVTLGELAINTSQGIVINSAPNIQASMFSGDEEDDDPSQLLDIMSEGRIPESSHRTSTPFKVKGDKSTAEDSESDDFNGDVDSNVNNTPFSRRPDG